MKPLEYPCVGLAVLLLLAGASSQAQPAHSAARQKDIQLTPIGTYVTGIYREGAAEIVAHDPGTQRLFVVNAFAATIDVLDISDPTLPAKIATIDMTLYGGVANSVAVRAGLVAVAMEASVKTDPGVVVFFNSTTLAPLSAVTVGAQPDMLTFTPNGRFLLVANEGEPNTYNDVAEPSIDPEGSISIIDVSGNIAALDQTKVRTADFTAFIGRENELRAAGIRIFGPNASAAQDLEPEYIAVSHDSRTAWVTLQENNALAVVDIHSATITQLIPLGLKDHMLPGNRLDLSDRDNAAGTAGAINIANWPVKGMYQPDSIASYIYLGETYLVMANEGDARDYPGFLEEVRVGAASYVLDPGSFPTAATLKQNRNLGRLTVSNATGDLNGDGKFNEIHAFGARSFSIRTASGALVFDSGDQMEQATAALYPTRFNVSNHNNSFDSRSTSKGPEPEGVALGRVGGRKYAFIGLERIGGIMTYDVTNPYDVRFVDYVNNRNFALVPGAGTIAPAFPDIGDLGPEGLTFIKPEDSPNGFPLLVVGNEVSGTTTIYQINQVK
jgi:2',3'-cyclic-nucleotide 2'-phosphodiesterase / 3'-nucleotidase / 5'-nucleotidase